MSGFALVCLSETPPDFSRVAAELMDQVDETRADLIRRLGQSWGVLLEGLSEQGVRICEQRLRLIGVPVAVVPDDDLVDPPKPLVLKAVQLDGEALSFSEGGTTTVVPWDEFVYVDLIAILHAEKVQYEETVIEADEGASRRYVKKSGIVTTTPSQVVAVSHEPWLQLRFEVEGFRFGGTGLPLRPNRLQNLLVLGREIAARSKKAHIGTLLKGPEPEMPPRPVPIPSEVVADNRLRWRLTCIYRGLQSPPGLPASPR
jgi:hypothetical protein